MRKVSIIIPVYNSGDILRTTIDSILGQTYNDWELVLVDDGSTDGSGLICDEYSSKDERIKSFHKSNGGICSARNYGLGLITGDYLAFCDHDDIYCPQLLERGVAAIEKYGADIAVYRYENIFDDGKVILSRQLSSDDVVITDVSRSFCELYCKGILETVWSMIYRVDRLVGTGVRFSESYKFGGEDINFNAAIAQTRPSYVFVPDVMYRHYIRHSLSTSAKHHPENAGLHLSHLRQFCKVAEDFKDGITRTQLDCFWTTFDKLSRLYLSDLTKNAITYKSFKEGCKNIQTLKIFDKYDCNVSASDPRDKFVRFLLSTGSYRALYHVLSIHNHRYHKNGSAQ